MSFADISRSAFAVAYPLMRLTYVATQESVNIELDEIFPCFSLGVSREVHHALFPPHKPWLKSVFYKFQATAARY